MQSYFSRMRLLCFATTALASGLLAIQAEAYCPYKKSSEYSRNLAMIAKLGDVQTGLVGQNDGPPPILNEEREEDMPPPPEDGAPPPRGGMRGGPPPSGSPEGMRGGERGGPPLGGPEGMMNGEPPPPDGDMDNQGEPPPGSGGPHY